MEVTIYSHDQRAVDCRRRLRILEAALVRHREQLVEAERRHRPAPEPLAESFLLSCARARDALRLATRRLARVQEAIDRAVGAEIYQMP